MRRKTTLFLPALIALTGCSSVSDVAPVGKDTFRVSSEMGGQLPSWSDVKALSIAKANEHCRAMGAYMEEVRWDTHGARGWTPLNAELTFICRRD